MNPKTSKTDQGDIEIYMKNQDSKIKDHTRPMIYNKDGTKIMSNSQPYSINKEIQDSKPPTTKEAQCKGSNLCPIDNPSQKKTTTPTIDTTTTYLLTTDSHRSTSTSTTSKARKKNQELTSK